MNALFEQPNIIPISNFVNDWHTQQAWETDPLLHTLDIVFELSKEPESSADTPSEGETGTKPSTE